ncbi:E3 ubiquitin-protein ligase RHA1B [Heracleum sosnowskyi]|uniref:E3 ubiquitin-protein ligase RHA1B n=1 Tax=Heracleum sosnowskyi TaxID=360622 RepID=A0AAD8MLV7_9APIA|nr:E3 ubiquitin-protein ligase RHA1B [Heracleum sosnowskyi]
MGFPAGYTEVFFPKLFIHTLSFLGLIKTFISSLLPHLGLQHYLQPDFSSYTDTPYRPEYPPLSAVLLREFLPVVKFEQLPGDSPQSCAVCLYELEHEEEIRTQFVPRGLQDEFDQRLWAASGISSDDYYYSEYNSVSGF